MRRCNLQLDAKSQESAHFPKRRGQECAGFLCSARLLFIVFETIPRGGKETSTACSAAGSATGSDSQP